MSSPRSGGAFMGCPRQDGMNLSKGSTTSVSPRARTSWQYAMLSSFPVRNVIMYLEEAHDAQAQSKLRSAAAAGQTYSSDKTSRSRFTRSLQRNLKDRWTTTLDMLSPVDVCMFFQRYS